MNVKLDELDHMRGSQLREFWAERFGEEPPETRSTDFLRLRIAWRLQEKSRGGLRNQTRRRLKKLAKAFERDAAHQPSALPQLKSGTTLTREWQGMKHSVEVLNEGFKYRGISYPSLSSVARTITGTRWSGPVFFGLKKAPVRARAGR